MNAHQVNLVVTMVNVLKHVLENRVILIPIADRVNLVVVLINVP